MIHIPVIFVAFFIVFSKLMASIRIPAEVVQFCLQHLKMKNQILVLLFWVVLKHLNFGCLKWIEMVFTVSLYVMQPLLEVGPCGVSTSAPY